MMHTDPARLDALRTGGRLSSQLRMPGSATLAAGRRTATPAEHLALRRLRYHLDLLESGYRQALHPERQVPSQRTERIALGIDKPELDTIPLWSVRRADGAIAIPFIDTVLKAILRDLEPGANAAASFDPEALPRARESRQLVERLAQAIARHRRPEGAGRHEDCFLPEGILARICGSDSPLRRLGRRRLRAGQGLEGNH